jgi:hypothetical protein
MNDILALRGEVMVITTELIGTDTEDEDHVRLADKHAYGSLWDMPGMGVLCNVDTAEFIISISNSRSETGGKAAIASANIELCAFKNTRKDVRVQQLKYRQDSCSMKQRNTSKEANTNR